MTPFVHVRRYRCGQMAGAGLVWPRGRLRRQDLRIVDLDLGDGDAILERLWERYENEPEGPPRGARFGGFELRRGWLPLHVRVLRMADLLSSDITRDALDASESMAIRAMQGLRFVLPSGDLKGGDTTRPYEMRLALDGGLDRGLEPRGCGTPTFFQTLECVPKDPDLDRALSSVRAATSDAPPWIRHLLDAQVLFNARYFAGAHESARRVLLDVPNEPHAVALIYATYVEGKLDATSRATRFGHEALEPLRRMRARARTTCDLERGDAHTLR